MKQLTGFVLCLVLIFLTPKPSTAQDIRCNTTLNYAYVQANSPSMYQHFLNIDNFIAQYISSGSSSAGRLINPNGTIVIPVVVHVLHNGGAEGTGLNISQALIQSQIDVLNEDFRRLNADRVNTPADFAGRAADFNIEFRLACVDPNGNATNGIVRKQTSRTTFSAPSPSSRRSDGSYAESQYSVKKLPDGSPGWPPNKYLNIWVCSLSSTLGYATFPKYLAAHPDEDGVVVRTSVFGRRGSGSYGGGRTLTHELGHWLDLYHLNIDANSTCSDDFVGDTPKQTENHMATTCPPYPETATRCNATDPSTMWMNFMDLPPDNCMNLFTNGQKQRARAMFATIGNSSGPRASMINNSFGFTGQPTSFYCEGSIRVSPMCLPVVWTVSGPATITGGQGTSQVSFSATGTGSVHLVATSGNYIAETDIAIGIVKTPTMLNFNGFNYSEQNTGSICLGGYADYEVSVVDAVAYTTYWWSVSGAADFRFGQGSNAMGMTVEDEPGSYVYVTVQPENNCGLGDALNLTLQICDDGLGLNKTNVFVVSPNPASEMITIQKKRNSIEQNAKQDPDKTVITEVKIFDNMGTLMKQIKYGKETTLAQVNVAGLKKGIYYVEISTGKAKERQQLIIQK